MEIQRKLKIGLLAVSAAFVLTFTAVCVTTHLYREESEENDEAAEQIESLTSDVVDLESEIAELNSQIAALQDEVSDVQNDYSELQDEHTELYSDYTELQDDHSELQSDVTDISAQLSSKEAELQTAVTDLETKNRRIAALEKKVSLQSDRYDEAQTEKEELTAEIAELTSDVSALEEQIALLEADIVTLRTAAAIQSQAAKTAPELVAEPELVTEPEPIPEPEYTLEPIFEYEPVGGTNVEKLMNLLQYGAPQRWFASGTGNYYLDDPNFIAYGYYDLTTGEQIGYNADTIYYSASLIKAPYIYSVLREVSDFEKTAARDEDGNIVYGDGEKKYDLDELWTFDPETMMEEGSGEIQSMPAGTQMTWRELFAYVLLYSDNVAWNQIMDRFGFTSFYHYVGKLGIQGTSTDFMNLSVNDCIKFMREIYEFFETGDPYAQFMKENMMKSKHKVMICASFPEGTVPHKYGWDTDSYHDMAIIYDEHPYILVFMSDMHDGSDADNAYIKAIVELTKQIHAERYGG